MRMHFEYCKNCSSVIGPYHNHVYDDREDNHFCDKRCFEEWAEDSHEVVVEFYYRLNCKETGR
ncbi:MULTISPECIES: hypothetical protein [Bacillus]|uniref:hypothetical protein n=1 Tax=Bacillus TaxID=1386 RepID=UPI0012B69A0B|nr:hypothetical protein [Bacillus cereus]